MALLNILEFSDPRLRNAAKPIENVNSRIAELADQMLETMYAAPGIDWLQLSTYKNNCNRRFRKQRPAPHPNQS